MKKIIMLVFLFVFAMPFTALSESSITVKTNGVEVNFPDAKPYVDENSRTLVPVRFISESLGAKVGWDEKSQMVTITKDKVVKLVIGSKKVKVDAKDIDLDTMPVITDSRTFVPLRFVSEAFGATVTWDGETRTVNITTVKDDVDYKALADMIRLVVSYEVDDQYDKVYDYLNPEDLEKKGLTREELNSGNTYISSGLLNDLRGPYGDKFEIKCGFKKNTENEIKAVYGIFQVKKRDGSEMETKRGTYFNVVLLHKIDSKWYIDMELQAQTNNDGFKYVDGI